MITPQSSEFHHYMNDLYLVHFITHFLAITKRRKEIR